MKSPIKTSLLQTNTNKEKGDTIYDNQKIKFYIYEKVTCYIIN